MCRGIIFLAQICVSESTFSQTGTIIKSMPNNLLAVFVCIVPVYVHTDITG